MITGTHAAIVLVPLRQRSDDIDKINRKVSNGTSSGVLPHEPAVTDSVQEIQHVPFL